MPRSRNNGKTYRGNTYLLTSREYRQLSEKINDVLGQLRVTQQVLRAVIESLAPAENPGEITTISSESGPDIVPRAVMIVDEVGDYPALETTPMAATGSD